MKLANICVRGFVQTDDNVLIAGALALGRPNKHAIIDSTIPPPDNHESAIVSDLSSGGSLYTAIVRGVSGTAGVAVVEVYALN